MQKTTTLAALAAHAGHTTQFLAAGAQRVQLAAFATTGLIGWLKDNAIPLVVIIAGISVISGAHKKDMSGAFVKGAIVLLGLGVIGAATNSFGLGTQLAGLVGL